jgi:hypothetical protein
MPNVKLTGVRQRAATAVARPVERRVRHRSERQLSPRVTVLGVAELPADDQDPSLSVGQAIDH